MTASRQQAIFPDLPRSTVAVKPNGEWQPEWRQFFEQLVQALQQNYTPEGLILPSQTAANITLLTNSVGGTLLYDSTDNVGKINLNGTWHTITTS
jgi:hypothetical protein